MDDNINITLSIGPNDSEATMDGIGFPMQIHLNAPVLALEVPDLEPVLQQALQPVAAHVVDVQHAESIVIVQQEEPIILEQHIGAPERPMQHVYVVVAEPEFLGTDDQFSQN